MSDEPRQRPRDETGRERPSGIVSGRAVARQRRPPAPARIPPRRARNGEPTATAAQIAALRRHVLRSALTLPGVALGESRLDLDAAGLFVRFSLDDGARVEMREFATLRTHPRWRLSALLPIGTIAMLQRLGWGRPRHCDQPGTLLLELVRPRSEAEVPPLQHVLAAAYRAAADPQGRNR
jgi:hypothetical protein